MKFKIVHDTPGRIRLRCGGYYFDKNQEKSLEKTILSEHYVDSVKAKSVNGGILITYQSDYRQELLNYIKGIKQNQLAAVEDESEDIQADFKNEIIKMLIKRFVLRRILPYPVRVAMAYFKAFPYVKKAVGSVLNLRADVALLDGVALGTALSRGMYSEVNSITFLLGVSELLEEYTRKRTKNALADSLAMKIDTVWKKNGENEEQVPISTVKEGDFVVFRDGAMITFDGVVVSGQASVNEASMTGESVAAVKDKDSTVYAGTVVEAGNIVIKVSAAADNTRISNIIEMIENGEVHKWVQKRTALPTLDREYDFNDIAIITRAAPAKIYGFRDRGALTPGYKADIAVYDINPNEIDPSRQYAEIEKGFSLADYTIKDGQILVKDKEIVKVKESQNIWVNVQGYEHEEQNVINKIMPFFTQYYSVKWENYPVHDHYVSNPIRVDVKR